MKDIVKLLDIVNGTVSNDDGDILYNFIVENLSNESKLTLSFADSTPISSSFFNSSFGVILDKYGYEFIKNNIRLIDLTKSQKGLLAKYFNFYLKLENA